MSLLTQDEQARVAAAIADVEQRTDAELVTVLAASADDYRYIPLLWAALAALLLPGALNFFGAWLDAAGLLLVQWCLFVALALVGRIPAVTARLIPAPVRRWRAGNLARRQFLEQNLHHTLGGTGVLIFVSEAERYVEIIVDHGICSRIDNRAWQALVTAFTEQVRQGRTADGFLECIRSCGELLETHVPVTHTRDELPNRLVILT